MAYAKNSLALLGLVMLFSGCAVRGKGILLSVEPATPLDERDLQNHCDLGDQAACALNSSNDSEKPAPKFAIIQGVAPPDRAVFAALLPADSAISWFIYDRELNRLWKLHDNRKQKRAVSAWYVQRIEARELDPARTYELLAGDQNGTLIEDRIFQSLPQDGQLRFGVVSGLGKSSRANIDQLLSAAVKKEPALLLFTGANVNVTMARDKLPEKRAGALDYFFEKHAASRNALGFSRERKLIPTAATWSDAEFGLAEGNRTFAYKDQAREIFEIFFPVWADETTIVNGPGVSKMFRFGGQTIALLDDRSFRIPDGGPPPCSQVKKIKGKKKQECTDVSAVVPNPLNRFGKMQGEWAFRHAQRAQQQVWLVSAEPWLGLYQAGGSTPSSSSEWLTQFSSRPPIIQIAASEGFTLVESRQNRGGSLSFFDSSGVQKSSVQLPPP